MKLTTKALSVYGLALSLLVTGIAVDSSQSLAATMQVVDPITVVGENNWDFPALPRTLPWSRSALSAGNQAIDVLSGELTEIVGNLKDSGAVQVVTLQKALPQQELRASGLKASALRFIGLDANGKVTSRSDWWPGTQTAFANTLVTLNANKCSLRDFSLLDWGTWFESRCEVVKPTADQFLRAQLAAQISFGSGNAPDMLRYELEKLRVVLSNGWKYSISGSVLSFVPEEVDYGNNTVWLGEFDQWYGYRISINRQQGTATLRYARPDFKKICKSARFDRDLGIVVF